MYLNDYEKSIIGTFYNNIKLCRNNKILLKWDTNNYIIANFDTCFEDDNDLEMDEDKYEEFTSFAFTVISVSGKPPVYITEDNYFLISYHNFPNEIFVNGEKIN